MNMIIYIIRYCDGFVRLTQHSEGHMLGSNEHKKKQNSKCPKTLVNPVLSFFRSQVCRVAPPQASAKGDHHAHGHHVQRAWQQFGVFKPTDHHQLVDENQRYGKS